LGGAEGPRPGGGGEDRRGVPVARPGQGGGQARPRAALGEGPLREGRHRVVRAAPRGGGSRGTLEVTFSLQGVRRWFDGRAGRVAALDGVSLVVAPGERLVVLGPSGAGKTTLFGLLNTTLRPSEGTVRFEGQEVMALAPRQLRAVRRRIGTVFQQPRLVPSL